MEIAKGYWIKISSEKSIIKSSVKRDLQNKRKKDQKLYDSVNQFF